MKVLQIGTFDRYGGACIGAYRQHEALLRAGVDSRMWVRFKRTGDPSVSVYSSPSGYHERLLRGWRRHLISLEQRRAGTIGEFLDERSELAAELDRKIPEADVYNIQFSQGFLDHRAFFESIPAKKPVVMTLHEMSWFTGGCSYSGDCRRFEQNCGQCPLLSKPSSDDFSRRGWERRQKLYEGRQNIHLVANSEWTLRQAKSSGLLRSLPMSVIHLGVDTSRFRPVEQNFPKTLLNIPQGTFVVAFAAATTTDKRKGMGHLFQALRSLHNRVFLLTWGRGFPVEVGDIPHLHLGNLDNEQLMALAYNAADVFVMPSLEESFGQTALEAVACGVPVVAFDVGGVPDTVKPGLNGCLVPRGDSRALADGIDELLGDQAFRDRWRSQAREWTEEHFSYEKNAFEYISLYRRLLEQEQV